MTATTIEAARIAGAIKCVDALSKLDLAAQKGDLDQSISEFYAQRLSDARAFVAALGSMTTEQEGAITVLAEYIHAVLNDNAPGLEEGEWTPLSAMTNEGRQVMIDRLEAKTVAQEAARAQRKLGWVSDIAEFYDDEGNYHPKPIPEPLAKGSVLYLVPKVEGISAP